MVADRDPPGRVDVAGLGDHLEILLGIQQQMQAAAHDLVIVGDHEPDLARRLGFWFVRVHAADPIA